MRYSVQPRDQIFKNRLVVDANGAIIDFNAANASTNLFSIKAKITGQTGHNGTKKC